MKFAQVKKLLTEAATTKAQAQRMMRDITEILKDKSLPAALRNDIENLRASLRKTWKELADDAQGPVAKPKEAFYSEFIKKEDDEIVLYTKDKKKVIARFPFGKGKKYADEEAARSAAWKQETKIKYAKSEESGSSAPAVPVAADIELTAELDLEECEDAYATAPPPSWGAKSFSDLNAARAATEATGLVYGLTYDLQTIISAIIGDPTSTDKVSELRVAFDEFLSLVSDAMGANLEAAVTESDEPISLSGVLITAGAFNEPIVEKLAESNGGALALIEADSPLALPSARDPLKMDVRIITPGMGNGRDKHYYPREVLERDAAVFKGVKMYATDHRDSEKSVRTEVAQIESITGFADDGAPIARVNIFDPAFAEQTRNRAKSGALKSLECSILAYGEAKPGLTPDGIKANIVTKITQAQSVDWVTKAGAGGYALRLAESADPQGDQPMNKEKIIELLGKSVLPEAARKRLALAEYADEAALTAAITAETDYLKALAEVAAPPEAQAQPVTLAEADVKAALDKTTLPQPSRKRLAEHEYKDKAALDVAVKGEIAYLKEVTGSGRPVTAPAASIGVDRPRTLAETNKTVDAIVSTAFGMRERAQKEN